MHFLCWPLVMDYSLMKKNKGVKDAFFWMKSPTSYISHFPLYSRLAKQIYPWKFYKIKLDPLEITRPKSRNSESSICYFFYSYPWIKFHIINPLFLVFWNIPQPAVVNASASCWCYIFFFAKILFLNYI